MAKVIEAKNRKYQPLYDSLPAVNFTGSLDFFKIPLGQADPAGVIKTDFHTNNTVSGQIPNRQSFLVYAIAVSIYNPDLLTLQNLYQYTQGARAYLKFEIRREIYLQLPLFKFTSGHGLTGAVSTSAANTTLAILSNGVADPKAIYNVLPNPILIPSLTPYSVSIVYETACPNVANTRIFVFLEGELREPIYK